MPTDAGPAGDDRSPVPGLTARRASSADAAALAAVQLRSRRAAPMPPPVHPDHELPGFLADRLRTDEAWVALAGDRVLGYARATATWLDDLYVEPSAAGCGVGSLLLDLVKQERPAGFSLWVFAQNVPARRFYAARGLVELETTDGSANEERAPDVRMAWPGRSPDAFWRAEVAETDALLAELDARRAALRRVLAASGTGAPTGR